MGLFKRKVRQGPNPGWARASIFVATLIATGTLIAARWEAHTGDNRETAFRAPSYDGLHWPELMRIIGPALIPLALLLVIEAASRTPGKLHWKDPHAIALPIAGFITFAYSGSEIFRLGVGMGEGWWIAALYALVPDTIIVGGTLSLIKIRNAEPVAVVEAEPVPDPVLPPSTPSPPPPPDGGTPLTGSDQRDALEMTQVLAIDATPSPVFSVAMSEDDRKLVEAIRSQVEGVPSPTWIQTSMGVGWNRAKRLAGYMESVQEQSGRAVG